MKEKQYIVKSELIEFDKEMLKEKLILCSKSQISVEGVEEICDVLYIAD